MAKFGPKILPIVLMAFVELFIIGLLAIYFGSVDYLSANTETIIIVTIIIIMNLGILLYAIKDVIKSSIGGDKKIMKYGRPAKARIISISEGGAGKKDTGVMTINEQPVVRLNLEVIDGNNLPYRTSIKKIMPRLQIAQLKEGAMMAIKIDPKDPYNIEIDPEGEGLEDWTERKDYIGSGSSREDNMIIEKEGIGGEAEILKVEDTGKSHDAKPIIRITFQINAPDIETYQALSEVSVSSEDIDLIRSSIGKKVSVKIHPREKSKVIINFDPRKLY